METSTKSHRVKKAYELNRAKVKGTWYIAECICGWSSPLCSTISRANELYAEHKAEAQSVQTTEGMEP